MSKLLIFGIDSMDRELISRYIDHLPNFAYISKKSPSMKSSSVFPPDSDTAWASIYTGQNPAKHGIVEFVDPLERAKINRNQTDYLDVSAIRNKTFWDIAGKFGKKVCILYPHIAYPIWPVNGFIINLHPETGEYETYPLNCKDHLEIPQLGVQKRIPRTKIEFKKYLEKKRKIVEDKFRFCGRILKDDKWDLFFFYSSDLDSIQHIFWNYCDPNDPTYPGTNRFEDSIKNFYILYDRLIGETLKYIDDDTTVLIFSDHGHSMRPVTLLNINEILRIEGYLFPKEGGLASTSNIAQMFKRASVDIAQRFGLRPVAQTVLRIFPRIKKSFTKPASIDFNKTIAHCTDLSGLKSYTYGGIIIRNENLNGRNKDETIDTIISFLKDYKIRHSDRNVFEWICRREELFRGEYVNRYPDIVFNLTDNYGVGWDIKIPIYSKSLAHKFYPGSHRGSTPIFYLLNSPKKAVKTSIELVDIAPTILDLLEIDDQVYDFDGQSIFKRFR